jgi:hypothetical protein
MLRYVGVSTRKSMTARVFRLKAEVYKTSRKARIKPSKTFSVSLSAVEVNLSDPMMY